ncbi:MAPK regulated corepressor interacting protein 2 [Aethina tumida]|uniref:MAPK regulated corepressor interacting protein 2 n=1 Tax=Aethina tumida TaxID=116153 RepID=UPI00096B049B|nr:MAPK regulated corepressor interacting protein 2 [Aethina tumida]
MYNIKGPSKIVAKTTRRGLSQNIDNLRDNNKNKVYMEQSEISNVPKPVFHKKYSTITSQQEVISPQHEEIIRYINESWSSINNEIELQTLDSDKNDGQPVMFYEDQSAPLPDFKPFDLESWWGKRLYAYITSTTPTSS